MKKIRIDCDEWYPVWSFKDDKGNIEVSDEEHAFLTRAFEDFNRAQKTLETAFNKNFYEHHTSSGKAIEK